jgi:hypothetical protein
MKGFSAKTCTGIQNSFTRFRSKVVYNDLGGLVLNMEQTQLEGF